MPIVQANGIRIHYQCTGYGPDIVFIHGLGANLAFWYLRIVPAVVRNYRAVVYDLRGHGRSEMPPYGYTPANMAADLDALLDHLQVTRAHLVGHSFGGAVALQYALQHPERVASLTLADARVRSLQTLRPAQDWPYRTLWQQQLREIGIPEAGVPAGEEAEIIFQLLDAMGGLWRGRIRDTHRTRGGRGPFHLWNVHRDTLERWRLLLQSTTARDDFKALDELTRDALARIRQPALAVFGEHSRLLETFRALQNMLPDCRGVLIPGVGHFHPLQKPALFVQSLRTFLHEQEAR